MNINPEDIKPGDTVKVRLHTRGMGDHGVAPVEVTTQAYGHEKGMLALGYYLNNTHAVTILEHVPARPDWADAQVIRIMLGNNKGHVAMRSDAADIWLLPTGEEWLLEELMQEPVTVTVMLDGDGNPPHPQACAERVAELQEQLHAVARERDEALSSNEPVWLDADQLDQLPFRSLVLPKSNVGPMPGVGPMLRGLELGDEPRWFNAETDWVRTCEIAPARVLYTPEATR